MSYAISARFEVPMGHRLQRHNGKCRFLHGHNYEIEVTVSASIEPITGMVMDFSELKKIVKPLLDSMDHALMLEDSDPWVEIVQGNNLHPDLESKLLVVPYPPTAENIAKNLRLMLMAELRVKLELLALRVDVFETRDCCATAQ